MVVVEVEVVVVARELEQRAGVWSLRGAHDAGGRADARARFWFFFLCVCAFFLSSPPSFAFALSFVPAARDGPGRRRRRIVINKEQGVAIVCFKRRDECIACRCLL